MPTPGREAESLMGHPLSFLHGRRPLKQTNKNSISVTVLIEGTLCSVTSLSWGSRAQPSALQGCKNVMVLLLTAAKLLPHFRTGHSPKVKTR